MPAGAEDRLGPPAAAGRIDPGGGDLHQRVLLDVEETLAAKVAIAAGVAGIDRGGVERRVEPLGAPVRPDVDASGRDGYRPVHRLPEQVAGGEVTRVHAVSTVHIPAPTRVVVVMPGSLR